MEKAHKQTNFEWLYILQQGENVESLRYRHSVWQNKEYAQLLSLDNAREEIILKDGTVSYLGYDFHPFSLKSEHILDRLPSVLFTHFDQLTHYHFVDVGKTRIADNIARVIRIVPQDHFRYQYTLWIDEQTNLLLKSTLQDRDNHILEEFRVLAQYQDDQMTYIVEPIRSLATPPLIVNDKKGSLPLKWQPNWLPAGFKCAKSEKNTPLVTLPNEPLESLLCSDGLASFSLYFAQNQGVVFNEQFWQDGKLSIYGQTVGDRDLILVGDIPLLSAKHIVQQFSQKISFENFQEGEKKRNDR